MSEVESLKKDLAAYGRKAVERKLVVGSSGNISARAGDIVYVSPSGFSLDELGANDYIGVDLHSGEIVDGTMRPTCEISMHLACYLAREDIRAIVHTHQPYTTGLITAGLEIEPVTQEFVVFVGKPVILDCLLPGSKLLAESVAGAVKEANAVLLRNHGCITVGANLKEAFCRAETLEDAAHILFIARLVGKPRILSSEEVEAIKNLEIEDYRTSLIKKIKRGEGGNYCTVT